MKLNEKIRILRKNNNLTEKDLAKKLNVTKQSIYDWENNNATPNEEEIKKICDVFDISVEKINDENYNVTRFHDVDEIKPRKWLMILLIIIELVIAVFLVNQFIVNQKEKSKNGNKSGSIFNKDDSFEKKAFNSPFEMYLGTQSKFFLTNLFDKIVTNNKTTSDHLITVSYGEIETSVPDEITNIKNSLSEDKEYEASANYDANGYINHITIANIKNKDTADDFNFHLEHYSGTNNGFSVGYMLDDINTSNKKNPDQLITIVYGSITTTDENEIINIKQQLDGWHNYEVIFSYDDIGYISQINIRK